MRFLKVLGLGAVAAMILTAFLGAGTASATNLYKYTTPSANDKLAIGTEIVLSLESGTSLLFKDTSGLPNDTCTKSEIKAIVERDTGSVPAAHAQGKVTSLALSGCSHTSTTLANGELEIKNIGGTTNGTVISKGARITFQSTVFGISCVANTGAGTVIGTVTGAKSPTASAKMDINGVIALEGICGDSTWTGSYSVTSPTGLTIEAS
jgi:hypothetical protein